jgi:hypothetical protein
MYGIVNRTLLLWLNGLFLKGSHGRITLDDLPAIDEGLKSASLRQRINVSWNKRCKFVASYSVSLTSKVGANRGWRLFLL